MAPAAVGAGDDEVPAAVVVSRAGAGRLGIYTAKSDGSDVRAVALATEGAFSNADWGPASPAE